jgi:hypothetical protein
MWTTSTSRTAASSAWASGHEVAKNRGAPCAKTRDLDAAVVEDAARGQPLARLGVAVGSVDRHVVAAPRDGARHVARGLGRPAGPLGQRGDDVEDANDGRSRWRRGECSESEPGRQA